MFHLSDLFGNCHSSCKPLNVGSIHLVLKDVTRFVRDVIRCYKVGKICIVMVGSRLAG